MCTQFLFSAQETAATRDYQYIYRKRRLHSGAKIKTKFDITVSSTYMYLIQFWNWCHMLIVTDWGLHVMVTYSLLLYLHHKILDMLWSPVPNWNNNTITAKVIKVWTLKVCTTVHIIFSFPLIDWHHCLPIIIKLLEIPLIQAIVHCLKSFWRTSTFTVPLKLLGHL